jgi:hypothetical protein
LIRSLISEALMAMNKYPQGLRPEFLGDRQSATPYM